MADWLNSWLFDSNMIRNRITECDYISEKGLRILRIIGVFITFEIIATEMYYDTFVMKFSWASYFSFWIATYCFILYLMMNLCYCFPDCGSLWKLTHFFYVLTLPYGICVSITYWAIILPARLSLDIKYPSVVYFLLTLQLHFLNYAWLCIDFYFSRIEFSWKHYCVAIGTGICYALFNCFDALVRHVAIYPNITWKNWFTLAFFSFSFGLFTVGFAVCYCISEAKKKRYYVPKPKLRIQTDDNSVSSDTSTGRAINDEESLLLQCE